MCLPRLQRVSIYPKHCTRSQTTLENNICGRLQPTEANALFPVSTDHEANTMKFPCMIFSSQTKSTVNPLGDDNDDATMVALEPCPASIGLERVLVMFIKILAFEGRVPCFPPFPRTQG